MKKGYWVSLYYKVDNADNLKKYAEIVTPIIKSYGGKPLVRVESMKTLREIILLELLFGNFLIMKKQLNVINLRSTKQVGLMLKIQPKDTCK